jgi:Domain of unknown function (DUF4913)
VPEPPDDEQAPHEPGSDTAQLRVEGQDLDDLPGSVRRLMAGAGADGGLEGLLDGPSAAPLGAQGSGGDDLQESGPESVFILALDASAYSVELSALTSWVDHLLLPVYGREVAAGRPWCVRWHEHPEAVARLHALWLAWQQLTDADAGLSGPAVWHRDYLDHTLVQLRAPDGPFAACTTSACRPHHRLLPAPEPTAAGGPR